MLNARRGALGLLAAALVSACGGGSGGGGDGPTAPPGAFVLLLPANAAMGLGLMPTFTWDVASGAAGYRFQLSDTADFATPLIDQGSIAAASVTLLVSLSNGTTYFWRVYAENALGSTLATSVPFSFTTQAAPPGPPGAFVQTAPADGANGTSRLPLFAWNAATGATSYTVEVSASVTFAPLTFQRTGILLTSLPCPQVLDDSTSYFWRVTALNGNGNTLATGAPDTFQTNGPAPGGLDTSFGGTGKVVTHFGAGNDEARAVAVQSDGKIVAAGHAFNGTDLDLALARYNLDGTPDTTFDDDGMVTIAFGSANEEALGLVIQPDGKIVAAGYAVMPGPEMRFAVARFNSDGSLDTGFGTGGRVTTLIGTLSIGRAVALQSDGKIIVAGNATPSSASAVALARYTTSGALDTTFDTDGRVTTLVPSSANAYGFAIAIQSDDKAVVAGQCWSPTIGTNIDSLVLRYTTSGALDTTFDTDGMAIPAFQPTIDDSLSAVAIQGDGAIVAAGYFANSFDRSVSVLRLTSAGALDTSFDTDGVASTNVDAREDEGRSVVLLPGGKILVAGIVTQNSANIDFGVLRYTTAGALDSSFDLDGVVRTAIGTGNDEGYAAALMPDGRIVVAGYAVIGAGRDFALLRLWP